MVNAAGSTSAHRAAGPATVSTNCSTWLPPLWTVAVVPVVAPGSTGRVGSASASAAAACCSGLGSGLGGAGHSGAGVVLRSPSQPRYAPHAGLAQNCAPSAFDRPHWRHTMAMPYGRIVSPDAAEPPTQVLLPVRAVIPSPPGAGLPTRRRSSWPTRPGAHLLGVFPIRGALDVGLRPLLLFLLLLLVLDLGCLLALHRGIGRGGTVLVPLHRRARAGRLGRSRAGHQPVGIGHRRTLVAVGRVADLHAAARVRAVDRPAALLYDVGQLVGEHVPAGRGRRVVHVVLENDVRPDRERLRVHRPRRPVRRVVGVYPHVAEVLAEAGLHVDAGVRVERAAAAGVDHLVYWRTLLVDERAHARVADRALQAQQSRRAQHVGASGGRGAVHQVGVLRALDAVALGPNARLRVMVVPTHDNSLSSSPLPPQRAAAG